MYLPTRTPTVDPGCRGSLVQALRSGPLYLRGPQLCVQLVGTEQVIIRASFLFIVLSIAIAVISFATTRLPSFSLLLPPPSPPPPSLLLLSSSFLRLFLLRLHRSGASSRWSLSTTSREASSNRLREPPPLRSPPGLLGLLILRSHQPSVRNSDAAHAAHAAPPSRAASHYRPLRTFDLDKQRTYQQQYGDMYFLRLTRIRPAVEQVASAAWDGTVVAGEAACQVERVLDVRQGELCWVAGTVYMDMPLKPDILEDVSKDVSRARLPLE